MARAEDTQALRSMRDAVGAMRREVDEAIRSMQSARERLTTMVYALDLAVKVEEDRHAA